MRPDNQAVYKKTLGAFCVPLLSLIGFDLEIHFKTKSNDIKETWLFDGFISSLWKDTKLTWFVEIYIEKESAKSACEI